MADRPIFFHRCARATSLSITIVSPLSFCRATKKLNPYDLFWSASRISYHNRAKEVLVRLWRSK
jgi:hypothetical protein